MTKLALFVLTLPAAPFSQQFATHYTNLGSAERIWIGPDDRPMAQTGQGGFRFDGSRWVKSEATPPARRFEANGLILDGVRVFPRDGRKSWAPIQAHVTTAKDGSVWFASPQGIGVRSGDGSWKLFDTSDGLPWDEFNGIATAPDGSVWLATTKGAIHFDGKVWEYRQGRRWLPGDSVRDVAVDKDGTAWFATENGIGRIATRPMTFAEKARWFEGEIDKRHRRTEHEYVLEVRTAVPGDASRWTQHDSDNDGLWTSMYGAGECFAWAATKDPMAKARAKKAFDAMVFLRTVTRDRAPEGFVARTILPATGPNPNTAAYTPELDRKFQATRDRLWKIMSPRWPLSADGKWYWKADTSSDELDGHYFLYGLYFDLVAKGDPDEEARVREHVASVTDHLVRHRFQFVDYDGKVTRWGVFNPEELNQNPDWADDRALNSFSILSYLKTAEHITGDAKYARAAAELMSRHGYHINTLMAKINGGAGAGNQSDDEMAFMLLYNLLRYERDPKLRSIYALTLKRRWDVERPELNPLFHFIAAATLRGEKYAGTHRTLDLSPEGNWLEEAIDTLRRFPLDRFDWRHTNSHRRDLVRFGASNRGHRRDGTVIPIDERFVNHWNHDPWQLDTGGAGNTLADGAAFLLPYYMGLYHGFLRE